MKTTLRAAALEVNGYGYIVGDEGVLLARERHSRWRQVRLPTRNDLTAISVTPSCVVIVGRKGTIIEGDYPGKHWRRAETTSNQDLFAVAWADGRCYAAGANGTLLVRRYKQWIQIATNVRSDLRALWACGNSICAAGSAGTVLQCDEPPLGQVNCRRLQMPTNEALVAAGGGGLIVGTNGTILAEAPSRPVLIPSPLPATSWSGVADNGMQWLHDDGSGSVGHSLAVGDGGSVVCIDAEVGTAETCDLGIHINLTGVADLELDWLLVGEQGLIVHGAVRSVRIGGAQNYHSQRRHWGEL